VALEGRWPGPFVLRGPRFARPPQDDGEHESSVTTAGIRFSFNQIGWLFTSKIEFVWPLYAVADWNGKSRAERNAIALEEEPSGLVEFAARVGVANYAATLKVIYIGRDAPAGESNYLQQSIPGPTVAGKEFAVLV